MASVRRDAWATGSSRMPSACVEPVDLLETRRETAQTDLNLKRDAQVVLGRGPVLGQVVAGEDGEGLAEGLDRLVQPPQTLRSAQPLAQGPECVAQVVLGPGPVLGQVVAGVDGEGLAEGLHRLVQPPQTLRTAQPLPRAQSARPRVFWVMAHSGAGRRGCER